MSQAENVNEQRVLILTGTEKDAQLALDLFVRVGLNGCICPDFKQADDEMLAGRGNAAYFTRGDDLIRHRRASRCHGESAGMV